MPAALRLFSPTEAAPTMVAAAPSERGPSPLTGGAIIARYLDDLDARRAAGDVSETHFGNYQRSLEAAPRDADGNARYVGFTEIVGETPATALIENDLTAWLNKNPQWKSTETAPQQHRGRAGLLHVGR